MLRPALLALGLAAAPVAALDLETMTEAEREAFRAEVRAYLLENPEVLMEAISVLEEREAIAQIEIDRELASAEAQALFADGVSWEGGNLDGDLTLVEFIDYRCGFCRRAHPEVAELIESDGNIRIITKEFPILGEQSVLAARFALATKLVSGDVAYKEVSDALMSMRGDVTEDSLGRLADTLELPTDDILVEMMSPDVTEVIAMNHALGQRLQISGTPTFVLGDRMLRGYLPLEEMRAVVAEERADG